VSAKISQWASPIEFVSDEFGFLVGCSINPDDAQHRKWPLVPARLERFGLDGTREVIVESLPSPISSLSVSSDRKRVAVCSDASGTQRRWGECRVYSLDDGTLQSTFRPREANNLKAVFTGDSDRCLITCRPHDDAVHAYLVDSTTARVLQDTVIAPRGFEIGSLVSSRDTDEVFAIVSGAIGRFAIGDGSFNYDLFYSIGAFDGECHMHWLDYHAGTRRLAVGELITGSREAFVTRIVDASTRNAFDTQINLAGPMKFSPDGKALYILTGSMHRFGLNDTGAVHKCFLDQLR
jgi:hypothetical protein